MPVIDEYVQGHELFLKQLLNEALIPAQTIRAAINYSLIPGGKRIRPVLVYLTGELIDVPLDVLNVIAAAIELTHCYSLVHDDLPAMDNDDFRRGKPSCHKAYDEATAILVGDGMQAFAIEILLTYLPPLLHPTQVIAVARELIKASGISGMISGQHLDLTELAQSTITEAQLKHIHHLKTGQLISACVEMVLSAQPLISETTKSSLRIFARHIGLVFQMQDDYLDRFGSANILGKGRSSDTANQKTTFATFLSKEQLEAAIANQYQEAVDALQEFGDKANALIGLARALEHRSCLN